MLESLLILGSLLMFCFTDDNKSSEIKKEETSCLPRYKVKYNDSFGEHIKVMSDNDIEMKRAMDCNFKIIDKVPHWVTIM